MGTAVNGKDMRVFVHDGDDPGVMVEVPFQGDATYNSGKSAEQSRTKNGTHAFQNETGASITFTFERERPALPSHTRLQTLSDSGEAVAIEYRDANSGGLSITGDAVVTLGEEAANVEGLISVNVTLSFITDPARGVTT